MKLRLFLSVVMSVLFVGCSVDNGEPGEPETPKVYVTLGETDLSLKVGETHQLAVETNCETITLEWFSQDEKIAEVSEDGVVTAISAGSTVVKVVAAEASATCNVVVEEEPEVLDIPFIGDYYYSDGTYSSEPDFEKEAIGIVFWVGNPTSHDPILKKEHPECTGGLVISINEEPENQIWQTGWRDYQSTVGTWQAANMSDEYKSVLCPMNQDDNLNLILGYNNTKVFEAFNEDSKNQNWQIDILDKLNAYREQVKTPEKTSGWYIPSPKELSLLYSGEYDGNVLDIDNDKQPHIENKSLINYKLKMWPGAVELDPYVDYWASAERDNYMSFYINTKGWLCIGVKDDGSFKKLRYVFAF